MIARVAPLIAGNWKMNGVRSALEEVDRLRMLVEAGELPRGDIALFPPATLLAAVSARLEGSVIATGGQDCHQATGGAHTGDISAPMLADAGARYVILGHSERRAEHGETDQLVRAKALAALGSGLIPIVCVGETAEEREAGRVEEVVARQLLDSMPATIDIEEFVIAYEPVWAIGNGRTPTLDEIAAVHATIRWLLVQRFQDQGEVIRILYGGSLKPSNAAEILSVPEVNGGLVGGASLLSDEFYDIISAL
ncbi:MAG TPA: triose-phosphate isomerase [Devosia sp.]|nr:triose-phosphate isomerase [Devosia sp.]